MAAQKYDVFISYRRDGGENFATILYERLTAKGYRVFQDVEEMNPGPFNEQLLEVIERCTDVIVICSKGALDRCANEGDWVRREIAHALQKGKNVVPVLLRNFAWPENLPEDLAELPNKAGVESLSGQAKTTAAAIDSQANRVRSGGGVNRPLGRLVDTHPRIADRCLAGIATRSPTRYAQWGHRVPPPWSPRCRVARAG